MAGEARWERLLGYLVTGILTFVSSLAWGLAMDRAFLSSFWVAVALSSMAVSVHRMIAAMNDGSRY